MHTTTFDASAGKVIASREDQARLIAGLSKATPNDKLLDIWCGGGELAYELSRFVRCVVGVDYSETLISSAQQKFPGVSFHRCDPVKISFRDSTFDIAVSSNSIHHQAKPLESMIEAFRVLKPNARIVVIMPVQAHRVGWQIALHAVEQYLPGASAMFSGGPLFHSTEPDDIADILRTAGFMDCAGTTLQSMSEVRQMDKFVNLILDKSGNEEVLEDTRRLIYDSANTMSYDYYQYDKGTYYFPSKIIAVSANKRIF